MVSLCRRMLRLLVRLPRIELQPSGIRFIHRKQTGRTADNAGIDDVLECGMRVGRVSHSKPETGSGDADCATSGGPNLHRRVRIIHDENGTARIAVWQFYAIRPCDAVDARLDENGGKGGG